eukprot:10634689-Alexandrium_andersonii.AAC.1
MRPASTAVHSSRASVMTSSKSKGGLPVAPAAAGLPGGSACTRPRREVGDFFICRYPPCAF